MMNKRSPLLAVPALVAAGLACAQQAGQAATPASASAFEGYRPFAAEEVQDWRRSNDTVRAIGGWRAYAREIQGAAAPAAAPPAPPASTSGQPPQPAHQHGGHQP